VTLDGGAPDPERAGDLLDVSPMLLEQLHELIPPRRRFS
jgi:hypothetical protein